MDFDLSWVLWGLPVAFVLGWLASRLDLRQLRIENRQAPKAYFKGLNFLLNEQQDQAIDAFIEAVQNDPDTSELHFALGNLFRRRGEYERAVRVHEHLLSRGDLGREERDRAQHALALDFLKAGLLDRAEDALRKLEGSAFEGQALLALLAIYERTRDWPNAAVIARKLEGLGQGNFNGRLAHYLCEQAAGAPPADARKLLREAMEVEPGAARPGMDLAALQAREGDAQAAFATLAGLANSAPSQIALMAKPLCDAATATGRRADALAILREAYERGHSLDVLEAIVALEPDAAAARAWYVDHLRHEPSLVAASKWLAGEKLEHEQFHSLVQGALDHAARP
ncbi:MAG TPA: lipopolysaccharide assembly protein LapB, partial [Ramlibacter sp.]